MNSSSGHSTGETPPDTQYGKKGTPTIHGKLQLQCLKYRKQDNGLILIRAAVVVGPQLHGSLCQGEMENTIIASLVSIPSS